MYVTLKINQDDVVRISIILLSSTIQLLCWYALLTVIFVNSIPHPFWLAVVGVFERGSFEFIADFLTRLPSLLTLGLAAWLVHLDFYLYRKALQKLGL
ncbi:hypothetical protein [Pluralibacter sp.]|jgi:hypothetical protein|uniref:hypothetical protein n=1 Tax=Pluralibacter sp. TaxID=1920032 RepID=UPI0025E814D0|nr:hypothetical protein [Pluralibacter sp.]MBV8043848.1 hypothetical protein [Pluralibacter sp.]